MELSSLCPPQRLTSHQEFFDKIPMLCQYLRHEAGKQNMSIKNYIKEKIPRLKEINLNHFAPGLNIKLIFQDGSPLVSDQTID